MSVADAIRIAKSMDLATAENMWLYLRQTRLQRLQGVIPGKPDRGAQPKIFSVQRRDLIAAIRALHPGLRKLSRYQPTKGDPLAAWAIPPGMAIFAVARRP